MRDPNRIPKVMALLEEGWRKVPDWRFGQLVENLKRYIGVQDLFYMEDDQLEKVIKDYFDLEAENDK